MQVNNGPGSADYKEQAGLDGPSEPIAAISVSISSGVTSMILPHGALVVVADGSNLQLFRNKAVEPEIELVAFSHPAVVASNAGSGSRHHDESANPDAHRKAEDGFAAGSAGQLNRMALDGAFDRIFIIADPRTLGELRKHFHAALQSRIVGELSKDLTGHSAHDIATAVRSA